jgi:hypothetical protein
MLANLSEFHYCAAIQLKCGPIIIWSMVDNLNAFFGHPPIDQQILDALSALTSQRFVVLFSALSAREAVKYDYAFFQLPSDVAALL